MNHCLIPLGTVALVLAAGAGTWVYSHESAPAAVGAPAPVAVAKAGDDEGETVIRFADAPEAVRAAVLKITSEENITRVAREEDGGPTSYEVQYTVNGTTHEIDLNAAGVLEGENEGDGEGHGEDD